MCRFVVLQWKSNIRYVGERCHGAHLPYTAAQIRHNTANALKDGIMVLTESSQLAVLMQ